jgi:hypothetical protein
VIADDKDPEIAAVLAKLVGQDAAAAEDAQVALEWIAGDQGRAAITQQRIQNFCWYDLPLRAIQRQMGIGQPRRNRCRTGGTSGWPHPSRLAAWPGRTSRTPFLLTQWYYSGLSFPG